MEHKTGAFISPRDYRDIPASRLMASVSLSFLSAENTKQITDISMLPVDDQGSLGICVAETLSKIKQYYHYKQTGEIKDFSERYIYGLARRYMGFKLSDPEGLYMRTASLVTTQSGIATSKTLIEQREKGHEEYCQFLITEEMRDEALSNKVEGFAYVTPTTENIYKALTTFGVMSCVIPVGKSDVSGQMLKVDIPEYYHAVMVYGIEYVNSRNDFKIYFRNHWGKSWGNNGNGYFMFKDFKGLMYDMYVYTDIPQELKDEYSKLLAKPSYFFKNNLMIGSKGEDVKHLQNALKYLGILNTEEKTDGIYGLKLANAVVTFQYQFAVSALPLLTSLAGSRVGPSTRSVLNSLFAPTTNGSDKVGMLDRWARLIQNKEGFYAPGVNKSYPRGTRSWRNNNPGNIRYVGMFKKMAVGEDTGGQTGVGFCIFATYEIGFEALKILLKNAATGKSSSYRSSMSLLQFFETYAPKTDGNDPGAYARMVANGLGVPVETPISELVN